MQELTGRGVDHDDVEVVHPGSHDITVDIVPGVDHAGIRDADVSWQPWRTVLVPRGGCRPRTAGRPRPAGSPGFPLWSFLQGGGV